MVSAPPAAWTVLCGLFLGVAGESALFLGEAVSLVSTRGHSGVMKATPSAAGAWGSHHPTCLRKDGLPEALCPQRVNTARHPVCVQRGLTEFTCTCEDISSAPKALPVSDVSDTLVLMCLCRFVLMLAH